MYGKLTIFHYKLMKFDFFLSFFLLQRIFPLINIEPQYYPYLKTNKTRYIECLVTVGKGVVSLEFFLKIYLCIIFYSIITFQRYLNLLPKIFLYPLPIKNMILVNVLVVIAFQHCFEQFI